LPSMQYETYHDLILEEFEQRKFINNSYSMRAFARDLGVSGPRLNQILAKKHGLSVNAAKGFVERLKLDDKRKEWFLNSVGALHARNFKERTRYQLKIEKYRKETTDFTELQLEYFKVISDWYHFAILELTYVEDFQNDHMWISEVLGITKKEVKAAIDRMISLDLLKEEDGTLIDQFKFLTTPNDTPSISLKKFNSQLIKKAILALQEQNVEEREIASNIFAINTEKIPEFKKKLREFRRDLEFQSNNETKKNAVYCLSMQFYKLSGRN